MRSSLFALITTLFLAACHVPVEEGKIPSEYLELASQYTGTFTGRFDGYDGTLNIAIDEQSRPIVTLEGFREGNLLKPKCQSSIGLLKGVKIATNKETQEPYLKSAVFHFNPGRCHSYGEEVEFSFVQKGEELQLRLYINEWASEWSYTLYGRFLRAPLLP